MLHEAGLHHEDWRVGCARDGTRDLQPLTGFLLPREPTRIAAFGTDAHRIRE